MQTFPSSLISILTPVWSIILFIVLPPAPITSFILSTATVVVTIFGAYFDNSFLGSGIAFNITSSIIISLAIFVLSKACLIISYVNPSILISTWIAVIPSFVPPTLKSISPKKSSISWISVKTI